MEEGFFVGIRSTGFQGDKLAIRRPDLSHLTMVYCWGGEELLKGVPESMTAMKINLRLEFWSLNLGR